MNRKIILLTLAVNFMTMTISAQKAGIRSESSDRLAIKELVDAYAHYADRRQAHEQALCFTKDARLEVFHHEPQPGVQPDATIVGRDSLEKAFSTLKKYDLTFHFNGQATIKLNGDRATGEVYCMAHHIWSVKGKPTLMIMAIRYYDNYVYLSGRWLFSRRKLIIDFTDVRDNNSKEPQ